MSAPTDRSPIDAIPSGSTASPHAPPTEIRAMHADDPTRTPDDRFDAAMRARHAVALTAVSPRVAAQLQQRRRAALAGSAVPAAGPRRFGWPVGAAVAASFAALLAVAIGLQSPTRLAQGDAPAVAMTATPGDGPVAPMLDADGDGIADDSILDEDPDFYAWLASSDATALAME